MPVHSLIVTLRHLANQGSGVLQIESPQLCSIGWWICDDGVASLILGHQVAGGSRACMHWEIYYSDMYLGW